MRQYSNKITFSRNSRGVYSIDPSLGCNAGLSINTNGCYSDCYAARNAKRYGYDFSKTVIRDFHSTSHIQEVKNQIKKIEMPFIRMGTMGDPSENWDHTIKICQQLQFEMQYELFPVETKEIVITTKHWKNLSLRQLLMLKKLKICINTSVSALDDKDMLENSLTQYERLKGICRSVLRVVTADFNKLHPDGYRYSLIQDEIVKGREYIDTVFRPSKNNPLVIDGVINTKMKRFISGKQLVSKANKKTYLGKCENCKEMCGVTM